jgi:hypothetical protein
MDRAARKKSARDTERGLREEDAMSEPRMLRPMDYGEICNEAFDLYKRNFVLFAGIGAVVYIPYFLILELAPYSPIVAVLAIVCLYLPMVVAYGAIVKALADRYIGKEATIAGSWRYVLRRLWPFLLTSLLAWLAIVVGFILLCVPGIIAAFWMFFVASVMIVEDRYYLGAFRRSRELAAGQWRRILNIAGLAVLLSMGVSLVSRMIEAIPQALLNASAGPAGAGAVPLPVALLQGLLLALVQTVVAPVTALLGVLLYFDVRVRKEGYDVELLAQEMGEPDLNRPQW